MKNNWIDNWTVPPTTEEQLDLWRIYSVVWRECELTPPGYWVRRWLQRYGNPTPENHLDRFFQSAIEIYMYPARGRRTP